LGKLRRNILQERKQKAQHNNPAEYNKPELNKESTVQASVARMLKRVNWPVTK
jgi:hypothetical protein